MEQKKLLYVITKSNYAEEYGVLFSRQNSSHLTTALYGKQT